jgi:uncharacterized protein YktB (UPF0637 family)
MECLQSHPKRRSLKNMTAVGLKNFLQRFRDEKKDDNLISSVLTEDQQR